MSTLSAVWIGWYAAIVSMRVGKRRFSGVLPPDTAGQVPETAKAAVPAAADRLMKGEREVLGVVRTDLTMPDWFWDPITGRRSSPDRYAFRIKLAGASALGEEFRN